jgi:hypothetical protein
VLTPSAFAGVAESVAPQQGPEQAESHGVSIRGGVRCAGA